jgi:hypothetical protein
LKDRWTWSARAIDDQIPRAGFRTTLTYRLLPTLTAGVEYNPRADKTSPLMNWLAVGETARRPAVIAGTSSDRIGTPSGQSFYVTLSKNLKRETGLPIAPYAGAAYGTYEDRLRAIGGLSVGFREWCTLLLVHDGVNLHPMLTFTKGRHAVSILYVDTRDLGASWSVSFGGPGR